MNGKKIAHCESVVVEVWMTGWVVVADKWKGRSSRSSLLSGFLGWTIDLGARWGSSDADLALEATETTSLISASFSASLLASVFVEVTVVLSLELFSTLVIVVAVGKVLLNTVVVGDIVVLDSGFFWKNLFWRSAEAVSNSEAANNVKEKITKAGFDPRLRTLCKKK